MNKIKVTKSRFIELCNEELKKHPDYDKNMKFAPVPDNADEDSWSGYTFIDDEDRFDIGNDVTWKIELRHEIPLEYIISHN